MMFGLGFPKRVKRYISTNGNYGPLLCLWFLKYKMIRVKRYISTNGNYGPPLCLWFLKYRDDWFSVFFFF